MAFLDSTSNTVIDKFASLEHKSFAQPSSEVLSNTEVKITASDGAASDSFGGSIAIGSGRIVIGARGDDDNGSGSGSAYIFDLDGNQLAKINAGSSNDSFGTSVAVGSGRIVVGASGDFSGFFNSGSAYIFDLNGNQLSQITPSDPVEFGNFGSSVAVGSGRIVVTAPNNNSSVYIFDLDGNELKKITAVGSRVAVGNGRILVGDSGDDDNGSNSGAAYIFDLDGNELTKITASDGASGDEFGRSVAVGSGRIVIATPSSSSGSAYIYDTPDIQHTLDILE